MTLEIDSQPITVDIARNCIIFLQSIQDKPDVRAVIPFKGEVSNDFSIQLLMGIYRVLLLDNESEISVTFNRSTLLKLMEYIRKSNLALLPQGSPAPQIKNT